VNGLLAYDREGMRISAAELRTIHEPLDAE
jgi:hypothetical protein